MVQQGGINIVDAIKYLKLDLRIMKEKKQYIYLILIPIFIFIMLNYIEAGLTCLLFLVMLYLELPFSNENSDKLETMYSLFPYRLSSMILGRFLYLNIMLIITVFICFGTGLYYFSKNTPEILAIPELIIIANFSGILYFFSYMLCYKAQVEKDNMIKTTVITIVLLIIFTLIVLIPMGMKLIAYEYINELNSISDFILNNIKVLIALNIISLIVIEYISFLVSLKICRRKEV